MNSAKRMTGLIVVCVLLLGAAGVRAQDWPQWRGPNRDAKATGFTAPKTWPKELTKKWSVKVGDGVATSVATPALVGDKLYVFTRVGGDEVIRCLSAADGKEVWQDKYPAKGSSGPSSGYAGPRCSPVVADGKVVTLGVNGTLSCLDVSGKKVWRKEDTGPPPGFFTSSSPMIVDGLCVVQLGSDNRGGIVALDLATGDEKWRWSGDGTAYASPVLLTVGGAKMIVAETAKKIVAVGVADGKLLWETAADKQGRSYNAATPVVDDQTLITSGGGRPVKAVKIEKKDDGVAAKELWSNSDNIIHFNTPVVKGGLVYGLSSSDKLFCINAQTGKTAWAAQITGGRTAGYGSIVDAGPVLLVLNPSGKLLVVEPGDKEFKEIASYKVASGGTFAYPVVSGNRVFVEDKDSLTLWTIE